jgi:hypothetical protein
LAKKESTNNKSHPVVQKPIIIYIIKANYIKFYGSGMGSILIEPILDEAKPQAEKVLAGDL